MLLGTINICPVLDKGFWMSFIVLNFQEVEWVDIFANPVFIIIIIIITNLGAFMGLRKI